MKEKNVKELTREYAESLQLITNRIDELKMKKIELETKIRLNTESAVYKSENLIEIEERLKTLLQIQRNVREIGIEAKNYYERSWWRSEKYTLNNRKPRCIVPTIINAFEEQIINKLISDNGDERFNV